MVVSTGLLVVEVVQVVVFLGEVITLVLTLTQFFLARWRWCTRRQGRKNDPPVVSFSCEFLSGNQGHAG